MERLRQHVASGEEAVATQPGKAAFQVSRRGRILSATVPGDADAQWKWPAGSRLDVIVIGGAFSGAASAIVLKRWMPEAKILVIEREAAFESEGR